MGRNNAKLKFASYSITSFFIFCAFALLFSVPTGIVSSAPIAGLGPHSYLPKPIQVFNPATDCDVVDVSTQGSSNAVL